MSLDLVFAQHVTNASTLIFRSLVLCVGILLWFDVCWCYGVVRLWWCGIVMEAGALVPQRVLALRYGSAGVVWYRYAD
jgi:hypothetical protein